MHKAWELLEDAIVHVEQGKRETRNDSTTACVYRAEKPRKLGSKKEGSETGTVRVGNVIKGTNATTTTSSEPHGGDIHGVQTLESSQRSGGLVPWR